jgi:hypothetical protein
MRILAHAAGGAFRLLVPVGSGRIRSGRVEWRRADIVAQSATRPPGRPVMPNPLCHFEFMTDNVERCKTFYGKVFDWTFDDQSMPGYTLVHPGAEPNGGIFQRPPQAPGPSLNTYFLVDSIEDTLGKVTGNGGQVIVPKTEIPNVGWFAMFVDPDGTAVGIFKGREG